jgi:hypothetical protein
VERSITAERLVIELEDAFAAAGGPPKVLRMDNGPELVSQALQRFCENKVGLSYIPPGTPWNNGYIESFNNRLRKECLNRNHWNTLFEARVVIGDFKKEHNHSHRHSALGYRTPAEYAAACRCTHTPVDARSTESGTKNPTLDRGGLGIGEYATPGDWASPKQRPRNHRVPRAFAHRLPQRARLPAPSLYMLAPDVMSCGVGLVVRPRGVSMVGDPWIPPRPIAVAAIARSRSLPSRADRKAPNWANNSATCGRRMNSLVTWAPSSDFADLRRNLRPNPFAPSEGRGPRAQLRDRLAEDRLSDYQ